jgi:hypothetical protein
MKWDFKTHSPILFSSEYLHYKIFIHEKCLENYNDNFQENLSWSGITDDRARYRAATRRLRNTVIEKILVSMVFCYVARSLNLLQSLYDTLVHN